MESAANRNDAQLDALIARARSKIIPRLTIHRYLPAAAFYFFFNSAGLPRGLFYTSVFAPLLFVWLYLKGERWLTTKFLLLLSPFIVVQLAMGVDSHLFYLRSLLLLWTVFVAVYSFCFGLLNTQTIERLFDELIALNCFAALVAVINLKTPLQELFWMDTSDTLAGSSHLLRLSMFTSEPSAYAELMLPLVIFAALRLLISGGTRNICYFAMICFPLLLTQSFGGLSISFAAICVTLLVSYRRLLSKPRSWLIMGGLICAVAAIVVIPNPIAARLFQVLSGSDSSTQSRTTISFVVAYAVASSKSIWWGVGLGQGKIVDVSDLGLGFTVGIIPNSLAGTFAELGIVGVIVRLGVEIFLFFRTRVYRNSFRLALFIATFVVQFTGSHLMDVQQYLMWCFAFLPFFPGLNLQPAGRNELTFGEGSERAHAR